MNCECLAGCPFFNDKMAGKPALISLYKKQYCLGDNSNCARFMVFKRLGSKSVPPNLFPNMQEKAQQLLSSR